MSDFLAYEAYAAQRMLPLQRIEFLLARVAMLVDAARLPGQRLSLTDYLLNPEPATPPEPATTTPTPATEEEADAIAAQLGF